MSSLPPVRLHSVGNSRVHSVITIREDPPPKLVGLYEHFLTCLKSLQTFVCTVFVLLYLTLQCKVRTAVYRLHRQALYQNIKGGKVYKYYVFVFCEGHHFK
jgi:hypothetical protein